MSGTENDTIARRIVAASVITKPGVAGLMKLLMVGGVGERRGGAGGVSSYVGWLCCAVEHINIYLQFQIPVQVVERLVLPSYDLAIVQRSLPLEPVLLKHPSTPLVPRERIPHHASHTHTRYRPLMQDRSHRRAHDSSSVVRGRKVICRRHSAQPSF